MLTQVLGAARSKMHSFAHVVACIEYCDTEAMDELQEDVGNKKNQNNEL